MAMPSGRSHRCLFVSTYFNRRIRYSAEGSGGQSKSHPIPTLTAEREEASSLIAVRHLAEAVETPRNLFLIWMGQMLRKSIQFATAFSAVLLSCMPLFAARTLVDDFNVTPSGTTVDL